MTGEREGGVRLLPGSGRAGGLRTGHEVTRIPAGGKERARGRAASAGAPMCSGSVLLALMARGDDAHTQGSNTQVA